MTRQRLFNAEFIILAQQGSIPVRITEVAIDVVNETVSSEAARDRLKAVASVTFDGCFAVHNLKIIQGKSGLHVAMPSIPLTDRCPQCSSKNPYRHRFCSNCGERLGEMRGWKDDQGRVRLYEDVAHPITQKFRGEIHDAVIEDYKLTLTER